MANSSLSPISLPIPNLVPPPLPAQSPPSSLAPTQSPPNANSSNSSSPPPIQSPPSSRAPPPLSLSSPPPLPASTPPPTSLPPPPPIPSSLPPSASRPPASPPPPTLFPPPPVKALPPPPIPQAVPPSPPVLPSPSPPNSKPPPLADPPRTSPLPPVLPPPLPSRSSPKPPPSENPAPDVSPTPPTNHSLPLPSVPRDSTPGTNSTPPLLSPLNPAPTGVPISPMPTNSSSNPNVSAPLGDKNSSNNGGVRATSIAVGFVVCFVALTLIALASWFVKKRKKSAAGFGRGHIIPAPFSSSQKSDSTYSNSPSSAPFIITGSYGSGFVYLPPEPSGIGNSKSWFTYEELSQVTTGFSEQNLLGEGGFGCVYKGCLPDGRDVAVKQLKVGGGQGEREFRAEVEIISRVHHRHLVSLVGYCISEHQRLLVYDYVPNNTLHYHLHGHGRPVMDWATRVRVAAGAARGIAYLHEDCHPRIIHRDIKSSNILLDYNFEALVSDFGLAKLALDSFTHVTTRVMGTFGYLAPEYASSGKLTEKSDVFSFGVVLLELITGRKPVDTSLPLGDESLVEWARPLMTHVLDTGELKDLVDPRLQGNYVESELFQMIEAAAACVRRSAMKRPRMSRVVRALDCIADYIDLTNGIKPGQSELFDPVPSAQIRMFRRMAFGSQDYSTDFSQVSSQYEREL